MSRGQTDGFAVMQPPKQAGQVQGLQPSWPFPSWLLPMPAPAGSPAFQHLESVLGHQARRQVLARHLGPVTLFGCRIGLAMPLWALRPHTQPCPRKWTPPGKAEWLHPPPSPRSPQHLLCPGSLTSHTFPSLLAPEGTAGSSQRADPGSPGPEAQLGTGRSNWT